MAFLMDSVLKEKAGVPDWQDDPLSDFLQYKGSTENLERKGKNSPFAY
jgi:hypothetical protein